MDLTGRVQVLEEAQNELEQMIGLNPVKKQIKTLKALFQIQNERKKITSAKQLNSLNLVFSGPPGTGKTTVARLLGDVLFGIGILEVGHVVEVDRSNLVANFVGQTASKTKEFLELALGGVLFIDEAYTLISKNSSDFGSEAIETILKFMEDNRGKICIIIAGYEKNMEEFVHSNLGLSSRFNKKIIFDNYNTLELYEIFNMFSASDDMVISHEARATLNSFFGQVACYADASFGNGRFVRNFYEVCKEVHALRIVELENRSAQDLNTFLVIDFETAVQQNS